MPIPLLSVFIVFGSAATLFFWVKWMGKLLEVVRPRQPVEKELALGEAIALYGLSAATFLACLFFPLISSRLDRALCLRGLRPVRLDEPGQHHHHDSS